MDVARVVALENPDGDALVGVESRDLLCRDRRRQDHDDTDEGR
jgi:hypothetical protein